MNANETSIKCTCKPAQLAAYKAAARKDGRTMASWIRHTLDKATKPVDADSIEELARTTPAWKRGASEDGFTDVVEWLKWLGDDNASQRR